MGHKKMCDAPQDGGDGPVDNAVSLAPLSLKEALSGLLAIKEPDATKPKHEKKRRKDKAE